MKAERNRYDYLNKEVGELIKLLGAHSGHNFSCALCYCRYLYPWIQSREYTADCHHYNHYCNLLLQYFFSLDVDHVRIMKVDELWTKEDTIEGWKGIKSPTLVSFFGLNIHYQKFRY